MLEFMTIEPIEEKIEMFAAKSLVWVAIGLAIAYWSQFDSNISYRQSDDLDIVRYITTEEYIQRGVAVGMWGVLGVVLFYKDIIQNLKNVNND